MSEKTDVATNAFRGISESDFIAEAEKNTGFTKNESIIPFTRILQALSPQLGNTPGAQPGMLLNVVSGKLTDGKEGMFIVPVAHQWNYTEWVARENGGGFVADWGDDEAGWQAKCEPEQRNAYKPITKDGNVIVKARHFFCFQLLGNNELERILLPFTGTGLKIARQWSSIMQSAPKIATSKGMIVPPYYYYVYRFYVEEVKNAQYRWFEPRVKLHTQDNKAVSIMDYAEGEEIFDYAKRTRDGLQSGALKAASQAEEAEASEDTF